MPEDGAGAGRFGDLMPRIGSALLLGAVALAAIWIGGFFLSAFAGLAAAIMVYELVQMCWAAAGDEVGSPPQAILIIGVGFSVFLTPAWPIIGIVGTLFAVLGAVVLSPARQNVLLVGGALAIGIAASTLVQLRANEAGFALVLWIILCVIAADVGAYFTGRVVGGPKLWPRISPGKTWSGVIGGLCLSGAVALIFGGATGGALVSFLALGLLIAAVSVVGDLAESYAKRVSGVKDSGNILPGHGGLLDRFDGLIAVLVLIFVLGLLVDIPWLLGGAYAAPALSNGAV